MLFGLLITIVLSIVILLAVALPRLREGEQILSQDGKRTVRRTRRQLTASTAAATHSARSSARSALSSAGGRWRRPASRHAAARAGLPAQPDRVIDLRDGVPTADQLGEGRPRH